MSMKTECPNCRSQDVSVEKRMRRYATSYDEYNVPTDMATVRWTEYKCMDCLSCWASDQSLD